MTVCYNAEATIKDTIRSVQAQRGVPKEHIIVDGGSSDRTLELVEPYSGLFAHIISEPDHGIYDAMQKGLERSSGLYTGFLNADDFFHDDDALLNLASTNRTNDAAGMTGAIAQITHSGKIRRIIGTSRFGETNLLRGQFPPHPATYLRTDIMRKVGGFDKRLKYLGDLDMFLRVLDEDQGPMTHTSKIVTKMRLGGISTRGIKSYVEIGKELQLILQRNGRDASWFQINARGFFKMPELIFAKALSKSL